MTVISDEQLEALYDKATQADDYVHQSAISASMLGGCRRLGSYALRDGWPEENMPSTSAAYLGTAIHDRLLADLAAMGAGTAEWATRLSVAGTEITGSVDLALSDQVIDLKTVSEWYYKVVQSRTPIGHLLQVSFYAISEGVNRCAVLYVNRSSGERFAVSWDPADYADQVRDWVQQVQAPPEEVPRDERGPGLSWMCDHCPFAGPCWGVTADQVRPPQAVVVDEIGVEVALEEYDKARAAEKKAKEDREFWRRALDQHDPAAYGSWVLGWSGGKDTEVPDVEAAAELLGELGFMMPTKTREGAPSIQVKRTKPDGKAK